MQWVETFYAEWVEISAGLEIYCGSKKNSEHLGNSAILRRSRVAILQTIHPDSMRISCADIFVIPPTSADFGNLLIYTVFTFVSRVRLRHALSLYTFFRRKRLLLIFYLNGVRPYMVFILILELCCVLIWTFEFQFPVSMEGLV